MRVTLINAEDEGDRHMIVLEQPLTVSNLRRMVNNQILAYDGKEVKEVILHGKLLKDFEALMDPDKYNSVGF